MKKMNELNKRLHTPTWLFILLLIVLILRIPSFFEAYSYGDEMIYLTLGEAIRQGITLYSGIHDNKPPLLYVLAAIAGRLFWFKAILAIWHLVTVFIYWKLSEVLFPKSPKAQKITTIIFALLTTLPLFEGNIANAEIFMIGPTIAAFLILLKGKSTFKNIFFSGILFSIATLFKVPAAFDVPAIVFIWLLNEKDISWKSFKRMAKKTGILLLGFLTPIGLTFIWYFMQGALWQYVSAAFLQNVGYLSSWRPGDVQKPFIVRNLPLIIRSSIVGIGLITLYKYRERLSKEFIFATSWLLLGLFAVALSERPYPHYLIQIFPSLSILLGILFTRNNKEQVLTIIPLFFAFLVPFYYKFWLYPTVSYYTRFVKLTFGQISREDYLSSFGSSVATNYKIADFVLTTTRPGEKIFVWGEGSPVYALTKRFPPGKYVSDYHIKDFSTPDETIKTLAADMPKLVVIYPNSSSFPQLNTFLFSNYGITEKIDGVEIWILLSNNVRALMDYYNY